jgi:hypothetical protein
LIVDPSSSGLTVIDQAPLGLPTIASRETFVFDGPSAALEVTTTYRGLDADGMRQRIAGTPREKMSADSLEYYSAIYPAIRAAGPIDFTDDPARDPIVVTERYAVKDPLGQGGLDLIADNVRRLVHKPHVAHRATPLAVPFPVFCRDEVARGGKARARLGVGNGRRDPPHSRGRNRRSPDPSSEVDPEGSRADGRDRRLRPPGAHSCRGRADSLHREVQVRRSVCSGGAWSTLTYGGREVTAGRAICSSCGERRLQYFAGTLAD